MNVVKLNQVMLNEASLNSVSLNIGGGSVPMMDIEWGDFIDYDDMTFMTADDMVFQVKV